MVFYKYFKSAIIVFVVFGMLSCVKDVDFDQAEDIALEPKLQVDLLIFDVDEVDFVDPITSQLRTVIRDTVRLEFLDDDYIQDNLQQVEFRFKYKNSFPQAFSNKISFLSENNNTQHSLDFFIGAGSSLNPAITEKIDLIEEDRIQIIKRSIKMVVEIEVLPSQDPFEGSLSFASKGLFSFEF
ncbi:hypothetical protein LZ575_11960 [Antarcticibacterium sp. 1MA-6-2]|uniref:hypothetical protein n=1 Tax=Antarcticibacterium sp. 1MA-6-2 TaxID=2908210 RepID=UPI001F192E2E|nr:hypothetical protein [Antarcticibacterium sp. 1MA-6-2]UJH89762.1 hypothetical protein LZ575_11960 [Antarcticibacterium sp. 1MA-6-2]